MFLIKKLFSSCNPTVILTQLGKPKPIKCLSITPLKSILFEKSSASFWDSNVNVMKLVALGI